MNTFQRTILILAVLVPAGLCRAVVPAPVSLTFNHPMGDGIGFRLQFGTNSGVVHHEMDIGSTNWVTLTNGPWGRSFVTVVAIYTNIPPFPIYITPPSNELEITNRPAAPLQLRMETNTTSSVDLEFLDGGKWEYLTTISNKYQVVVSQRQNLILRSKQITPPLPE